MRLLIEARPLLGVLSKDAQEASGAYAPLASMCFFCTKMPIVNVLVV